MKKNYPVIFKIGKEEYDLLNEVLNKLNAETHLDIKKSDLLRIALRRSLMLLKSGEISSVEFLHIT